MNEPRNPYAPPAAQVSDHDDSQPTDSGRFVPYGRKVPPGHGTAWIGDAWRMLKEQPGMWAAALVLMFVVWVIVSMIPVAGFFMEFLSPFAYAGITLAADQQRRTGTFELRVLLGGFEKHAMPLLAVGLTTFAAGIVFMVALAIYLGGDILGMVTGGFNPDPASIMNLKFWLAFLIGLALMLPITFATWLAPQLIVMHGQPALEAMKMSLAALVKNMLPGIVFGVVALLLLLVSMVPLLLGLLITVPILAITTYTVYRDLFVEEDA